MVRDATNVPQKLNYFTLFNVQGLKPLTVQSTVPYIQDRLREKNQLFIALSETWLADHKDEEVNIPGYTIFRGDRSRKKARKGRSSGGVALYFREDIGATMEVISRYSDGVNEGIITYSKKENLVIVVVYRQPDDSRNGHPSTSKEFKELLTSLGSKLIEIKGRQPDILVCGDFNLPHVDWPSGEIKGSSTNDEKEMIEDLQDFMNALFLQQIITTPTHKDGNVLDLVMTNNSSLVHSYECVPTARSISHHYIVEIAVQYKIEVCSSSTPEVNGNMDDFNFFDESIDWNQINSTLSEHDWVLEFRDLDPSQQLDRFLNVCQQICEVHVPKKRVKPFRKNIASKERKVLMRKRKKVQSQLRKTKNKPKRRRLSDELVNIEIKLQESYRRKMKNDEKKAVDAIKKNPKYFFTYAKRFSKVKTKIGPLMKSNGEYTTNPKEMADLLQEQYKSVFSKPIDVGEWDETNNSPGLHDITFDSTDVMEPIDELADNAAAGPDRYSSKFLKNCKESVSVPLALIFRGFLDEGVTPVILRLSHVIPIFKGGNKGVSANYRPVALTSHLIKVFEKIIRKNIVTYLEENNLFNKTQHGFRGGRSCLSQLLGHFDKVLSYLELGFNVDTIYLDFSKAFDKVDHGVLMQKLYKIGIRGKLGKWIYSFLHDRHQVVVVDGNKSEYASVISGVPQGSVLGPLLFLIMMGDIDDDILYAFLSSFADDTRTSKEIKNLIDSFKLQHDLNKIYEWADHNNMEFNNSKFEHLQYGKNEDLHAETYYMTSNGRKIEKKQHVKDLGVIMSHDCSFTEHINNVVKKAEEVSGWILRTFNTRARSPMLTLWKQLVIPHLDYCSQLWSPLTKGDIQNLEKTQRSFVRRIKGMSQDSYWEQLKTLKLFSIERRRERYIIMYVWYILEGIVPNLSEEDGITTKDHIRLGRKCVVPTVKRSPFAGAIKASLRVHGTKLFNAMPRSIRNMKNCSKEDFKRKLDEVLWKVPDEPQMRRYTSYRRADTNSLLDMISLSSVGLNELDM